MDYGIINNILIKGLMGSIFSPFGNICNRDDVIDCSTNIFFIFYNPNKLIKKTKNNFSRKFKKKGLINIISHSFGGIKVLAMLCLMSAKEIQRIKNIEIIATPNCLNFKYVRFYFWPLIFIFRAIKFFKPLPSLDLYFKLLHELHGDVMKDINFIFVYALKDKIIDSINSIKNIEEIIKKYNLKAVIMKHPNLGHTNIDSYLLR